VALIELESRQVQLQGQGPKSHNKFRQALVSKMLEFGAQRPQGNGFKKAPHPDILPFEELLQIGGIALVVKVAFDLIAKSVKPVLPIVREKLLHSLQSAKPEVEGFLQFISLIVEETLAAISEPLPDGGLSRGLLAGCRFE
jgi:hypothetical protein